MQALLLSVFVFLSRTAVLSEKNEVCEALVIHECSEHSRGLLKVLESGEKNISKKDCDALQVSHKLSLRIVRFSVRLIASPQDEHERVEAP